MSQAGERPGVAHPVATRAPATPATPPPAPRTPAGLPASAPGVAGVTSNGVEPDPATASGGVRTRATRQRVAVAAALAVADGFRTAQEIHRMLADQGDRVGLTTVYRHLAALVDSGEVDVLRADDGEALYRACATVEHHHHVVCRRCGATVEVAGDVVEQWAERVARAAGFGEITHQLEIFGVCRACRGGD